MGHNGGFNPYRDGNGEYATPEKAGKPGRSRKRGGGGGGGGGATQGRASTRVSAGRKAAAGTGKSFLETQRLDTESGTGRGALNGRLRQGPAYRSQKSVAPTRPAAVPKGASIRANRKQAAVDVVNEYAGYGKKAPLSAKTDNQTLVRRARNTQAKYRELMSGEEAEIL
ncbi:MAG: hypothetical protein HGA45_44360, partial [Chloroflexales bacterium]|nr:hypothetical protein [Chloroflexales bacterium]